MYVLRQKMTKNAPQSNILGTNTKGNPIKVHNT